MTVILWPARGMGWHGSRVLVKFTRDASRYLCYDHIRDLERQVLPSMHADWRSLLTPVNRCGTECIRGHGYAGGIRVHQAFTTTGPHRVPAYREHGRR
jgi:hypothetical protein